MVNDHAYVNIHAYVNVYPYVHFHTRSGVGVQNLITLLSGCVFLLSRAGQSCQVTQTAQRCILYGQLNETVCSRLEMEYVSGLEKLASQLEEEADIVRGFLVKNYGHFDSR